MSEDYDYSEDEALNRLSPEELGILDKSIEYFIQDTSKSDAVFVLVDNLIELTDKIKNIKTGYYENFDKLILKSKSLLESAYVVCTDKTVKSLIEDSLKSISQCLERLGIPKEEPEYYKDKKYYYKKNKYYYEEPKGLASKLAKEATGLSRGEEWRDIAHEIALTHDNIKKIDEKEEYDPQITQFILDGLERLKEREQEYQSKKKELAELSNVKTELKSQSENLVDFQHKLLMRCIDGLISEARE